MRRDISGLIKEEAFSTEQRKLYETMSDISEKISEECWFDGWVIGNERIIWRALQGERCEVAIDPADLENCRLLSEHIGGWIIWVDDDDDEGMTSEEWGPRFIPMDRWLRMISGDQATDHLRQPTETNEQRKG